MIAARALALTGLAAALAFLAWASGFDRMSHAAPALGAMVPAGLRSLAWRAEATGAILARRPGTAIAAAEHAVAADPLDAGASSLLGAARFAAGDGPGAAAAFRVAGSLGWRDAPAQLYWMTAALEAGDLAVASERLDALLRQNPQFDRANLVLAGFEATAPGRAALAGRLAARPSWLRTYLAGGAGLDPAQLVQRARVLAHPALRPARIGCDEVVPLVTLLVTADRAGEARAVWAGRCRAGGALLADGGFERAALASPSPFAWQFAGTAGVDIQLGAVPGFAGRALVASSSLPTPQILAAQALERRPGRYRLGWRAADEAGSASGRIRAALGCKRGASAPVAMAPAGGAQRFVGEATIAAMCPLQWLELALDPGAATVTLDDVTLTRLTP